jgi:hypothetical protein
MILAASSLLSRSIGATLDHLSNTPIIFRAPHLSATGTVASTHDH